MNDRLTKGDIEKMQKEIDYRKLVVRPDAIEAVKVARAQGDLSENFEYYAAKREKNQNESRIRYLERMINTATIIEDTAHDDEVGLEKTVTIWVEEDECEETYRIVTSVRGNALNGLITIDSPIGKALMGKKVGDRVRVKVNDSYGYDVVVRKIEKLCDESEDEINSF